MSNNVSLTADNMEILPGGSYEVQITLGMDNDQLEHAARAMLDEMSESNRSSLLEELAAELIEAASKLGYENGLEEGRAESRPA